MYKYLESSCRYVVMYVIINKKIIRVYTENKIVSWRVKTYSTIANIIGQLIKQSDTIFMFLSPYDIRKNNSVFTINEKVVFNIVIINGVNYAKKKFDEIKTIILCNKIFNYIKMYYNVLILTIMCLTINIMFLLNKK